MKLSKLQWYLLLIAITFIWSSVHPLTKILVQQLRPEIIATYRVWFSLLFLWPVAGIAGKAAKFEIVDLPKVLVSGFLGIFVATLLLPIGLQYSTAANSAIISNTHPIFVYLLSILFLGEKFRKNKLLWIIAAFAGIIAIVTNGNFSLTEVQGNMFGNLILLLLSISIAVSMIFASKLSHKYGGIKGQLLISFAGALMLLALFVFNWKETFIWVGFWNLIALLFMGIIVAGFCWGVFLSAIKAIGTSNAAVFKLFLPVFGAVLSVVMLGEQINSWFVIGGALTLIGVFKTVEAEKGSPAVV